MTLGSIDRPRRCTLGQILANVGRNALDLTATYQMPDVTTIDRAFLSREGVELVIWDVDGTLMGYHARAIASQFAHQIQDLFQWSHVQHAILSNCDERRFVELGTVIPDVPLLRGYVGFDGWITRVRRGGQDSHPDAAVRELLSKGRTRVVRKPDPRLVPHIMQVFGVTDPERTLVVGDQYLTDVATASLAHARSVKVDTFEPQTFPLRIRATQALERMLFAAAHRRRAPSAKARHRRDGEHLPDSDSPQRH